ncbi:MAG TPA: hypothetical protein VGN34_12625 [Ktedonobacteraceae bacterium]
MQSWKPNWQILIGSFSNRPLCQGNVQCTTCDDILLFNHRTGQMEQYSLSFKSSTSLYDNRFQPLLRLGMTPDKQLTLVNVTDLKIVAHLKADLRNEELY